MRLVSSLCSPNPCACINSAFCKYEAYLMVRMILCSVAVFSLLGLCGGFFASLLMSVVVLKLSCSVLSVLWLIMLTLQNVLGSLPICSFFLRYEFLCMRIYLFDDVCFNECLYSTTCSYSILSVFLLSWLGKGKVAGGSSTRDPKSLFPWLGKDEKDRGPATRDPQADLACQRSQQVRPRCPSQAQ